MMYLDVILPLLFEDGLPSNDQVTKLGPAVCMGSDPDPPNNAKEFGSSMKLDGLAKIMKVLRWAVGKEKIDQ